MDYFYFSDDGRVRIGDVRSAHPDGLLHVRTSSEYSCSGGPLGAIPPIYPTIRPIPEGGICRVETIRRRQRCVSCGNISWTDETVTCSGCQSQVFENI